jgi:hypothetical protein
VSSWIAPCSRAGGRPYQGVPYRDRPAAAKLAASAEPTYLCVRAVAKALKRRELGVLNSVVRRELAGRPVRPRAAYQRLRRAAGQPVARIQRRRSRLRRAHGVKPDADAGCSHADAAGDRQATDPRDALGRALASLGRGFMARDSGRHDCRAASARRSVAVGCGKARRRDEASDRSLGSARARGATLFAVFSPMSRIWLSVR